MGRTDIVSGPAVQGPAGCKAPPRCRTGRRVDTGWRVRAECGLRSRRRERLFSKVFRARSRTRRRPTHEFWGYCHADRASTICGGVQDEPHLIGERRKTGSSIRRQLALVQFDQIFHLPTRAIERVVDMLGRSVRDVGDDEADIEFPGSIASMRAQTRRSHFQDLAA